MNTKNAKVTERLPRIAYFTDRTDAGEFGAANCPHCGAKGRYIQHFICDDGSERGAMAGCIKQFKLHAFAKEQLRIESKERDYAERGWNIPSWDQDILNAIGAFVAGEISECQANHAIDIAKARATAYRNRKRR